MNRKDPQDTRASARSDLRSAEQDWRATKQPTNRPMPQPKRGLRVVTFLKWLVICVLVLAAGTYLYESQKQCESALGDSIYCVD